MFPLIAPLFPPLSFSPLHFSHFSPSLAFFFFLTCTLTFLSYLFSGGRLWQCQAALSPSSALPTPSRHSACRPCQGQMSPFCSVPEPRVQRGEPRGPRSPGFLGEAFAPPPQREPGARAPGGDAHPHSHGCHTTSSCFPPNSCIRRDLSLRAGSEKHRGDRAARAPPDAWRPPWSGGVSQESGCSGRPRRSPFLT